MIIIETPAAMRAWSQQQRAEGRTISLVPTMGALHAGHRALIDAAAERGDMVVVSIFVNPLQFNRRDDFDLYPRPIDDDIDQCAGRGVAAVYAPTPASMYPAGFQTHVEPGPLAEPLEGAGRPGHFRGVTTVVAKLFHAVVPHVAVFGRKDFQQLAIIARMVIDLDLGIEIVGIDIVREPDGLAMSSRNRRLDPVQRQAATVIPRALALLASMVTMAAHDDLDRWRAAAVEVITAEPMARLEYLEIVDPQTLLAPIAAGGELLVVTAVWFGEVRLIDNRLLRGARD